MPRLFRGRSEIYIEGVYGCLSVSSRQKERGEDVFYSIPAWDQVTTLEGYIASLVSTTSGFKSH